MTATLLDYAHSQFPGHEASVWEDPGSGLTLTEHTLVVHVVGVKDAAAVIDAAQRQVGGELVAAVVVRRLEPSVLPRADEDSDGLFDLPDRRLAVATVVGGVIGLALGFAVGALLDGNSAWVTLIAAAFIGVIGATLGFVSGGGARHASQRSVTQPQAPGRDVAIVAVFLQDEATAVGLAHRISDLERQYDVRIVSADGAWHAPND
jgi:hypothetical protein